MVNNTPIAITTNETSTAVVTNGGNVFQTGLISGKVQNHFQEILANGNMIGRIIAAEAAEDKLYLLNASGSVFEYDYNTHRDCSPLVREIYSPTACGGDRAVKIDTGSNHVLILTDNHKVWGAGNNGEYQLVPQGQCKYDAAVEVIITDTNLHDNNCCDAFTGVFNELEFPVLPTSEKECNKISCVKNELCDILLGYLNICGVTIGCSDRKGILSIPVYGDLNYVGFLCIGKNGCASGTLTYNVTRIFIKCGCLLGKFTTNDSCGCHIRELNLSSTTEILIFEGNQCQPAKSDLCAHPKIPPITGTSQINGKCGSCVIVNIDLPPCLPIPHVKFDSESSDSDTSDSSNTSNTSECVIKDLVLKLHHCRTKINILCDGVICDIEHKANVELDLDFDVPLDCCASFTPPKTESQLPQPCWTNIFAGFDMSVLVDNANRLYVLGSIHNIRNNKDLLKRSCLDDLLNKANASISFPADQLNCSNKTIKNDCDCPTCREKKFKTDLNKFGIHLSFPNGEECPKSMNVCDFLHSLKQCNESVHCDPTCEPCDGYIYLNVSGECGCPCGAPVTTSIGSVTLLNKRSICKLVSQSSPDLVNIPADLATIVEFDLNKYSVNNTDVSLEKIIKLDFCNEGPNVNLYLDIDQPGGIKFISNGKKCNVEFTVNASTDRHQFLLNFGSILDPVELTNLKFALSLDCFFPCPRFKNPFDTKITNTYVRGGDHVKFVAANPKNLRQAITADVPTVFRLNRRIVDVGVGFNNLTVLVAGLNCPNELFAIGLNCHGELGIGTNETSCCWHQVNRCIFDSQIIGVFSGKNVTFYITQTHQIYSAGSWKELVDSIVPVIVRQLSNSWKITDISITKSHIVFTGFDGCLYGIGDNSVGELGFQGQDYINRIVPLNFSQRMGNNVTRQLRDGLTHPMEANYKKRKCGSQPNGQFGDFGPGSGMPFNGPEQFGPNGNGFDNFGPNGCQNPQNFQGQGPQNFQNQGPQNFQGQGPQNFQGQGPNGQGFPGGDGFKYMRNPNGCKASKPYQANNRVSSPRWGRNY